MSGAAHRLRHRCRLRHGWLLTAMCLAACSFPQDDDLSAWIEATRARQQPTRLPTLPVQAVAAFRYEPGDRSDPFDPARLDSPGQSMQAAGMAPDLQRSREPLEAYALDSLRLVGSLRRGRQVVGLVEADKLIHQVRLGSHLGQDFGKVVAITDTGIEIDELVRESGGTWTRRRARLELQERR